MVYRFAGVSWFWWLRASVSLRVCLCLMDALLFGVCGVDLFSCNAWLWVLVV